MPNIKNIFPVLNFAHQVLNPWFTITRWFTRTSYKSTCLSLHSCFIYINKPYTLCILAHKYGNIHINTFISPMTQSDHTSTNLRAGLMKCICYNFSKPMCSYNNGFESIKYFMIGTTQKSNLNYFLGLSNRFIFQKWRWCQN